MPLAPLFFACIVATTRMAATDMTWTGDAPPCADANQLALGCETGLAAGGQFPADANDGAEFDELPWQRGERNAAAGAYKVTIRPHWFASVAGFWYRNDLSGGRREFWRVDATTGTRTLLFNHEQLAAALRGAGVNDVDASRLPIDQLDVQTTDETITFLAHQSYWRFHLPTQALTKVQRPKSASGDEVRDLASHPNRPRASTRTGADTELTFVNRTTADIEIFWLDTDGNRRSYGKIAPGAERDQHTFAGHVWEVLGPTGRTLAIFQAAERPSRAEVTGQPTRDQHEPQRRQPPDGVSPNGKWQFAIREHNIVLRAVEGSDEFVLTTDGEESNPYGMPVWSPNSRTLVAYRIRPGEQKPVYLIESSPRDGGRAKLHSRTYALPGDRFTSYELNIFDVETRRAIRPAVEPVDFGRPRWRWLADGRRFAYEQIDRGHQRLRVVEVDVETGATRPIIDEQSPTFIWTAHVENLGLRPTTWLEKSNEIIYVSERDGWRHFYLVDVATGTIKNQITKGEYVVRGIDWIDEDSREIWFRASGKYPEQDPYFVHYFRVGFDGGEPIALTDGNGQHTVQLSPDRKYVVDTFSRVDMAPVHELRRTSDGKRVCQFELADTTELDRSDWQAPEVFVAKGRDGTTDIWGIIVRPRNLDPTKQYPIIEDIYAGPHGSFVPKSFAATQRYEALTDLGFIVVKIDGMGTANRSKAFHDVCWKNLKDAGFPDRIAWMRAAAAKYPYMDTTRVGIYGTSAGGQNAAGALLFHPEFYKVAVAACGCHDNRMDKASWNEQWMGYPVGPHYAESSNIENASRLQGKLLLIVGEMDTNVPPESTLRFADALIRAGKDFELLVVPGMGHSNGGAYGQRRMNEFFVRHLYNAPPAARDSAANSVPPSAPTTNASNPSHSVELRSFEPSANPVRALANRYQADRSSLVRFYAVRESPSSVARLREFNTAWIATLKGLASQSWTQEQLEGLSELRGRIERDLFDVEHIARTQQDIAPLVPFAPVIFDMVAARQRVEGLNPLQTAERVTNIAHQVRSAQMDLETARQSSTVASSPVQLLAASQTVSRLREAFAEWFSFYNGYDPLFSWWLREPYASTDKSLEDYASLLHRCAEELAAATTPANGASNAVRDHIDLAEFTRQPLARMPAIIESFRTAYRNVDVDHNTRRGRANDNAPRANDDFYRAWNEALQQLPFAELSRDDQIDWLLLANFITYQRNRLALRQAGKDRLAPTGDDGSGMTGRPIGRDALLVELQHELIPYTPEELIAIADREYAWCLAELKKAAAEMGMRDDWRRAVETVKSMYVEPGKQPELIRDLAKEAIEYLEAHELVTVPPLARETWRMQMMSPERQLITPFFTGGEVISVSFPTDAMTHHDKLQSLRGNNIPFARATVHHELIPGHHLQGFMTERYRPYREPFATPFWGEGWALYWEFVLYDRGFPKTPQDRIGFLVWRAHRCARITFSLGFHLGQLTPQQCTDLLVDRVGFERNNAAAEVRRSIGDGYSPLYQAAYMLGGLQFRRLRHEVVDGGRMSERDFHDRILRENRIPIAMIHALFTERPLTRDFKNDWRFYDAE